MQWASFSAALSHLPAREQERIHRAFDLGKTMHGDQKRKSGEPYFTHPIAVAVILAGMGADADTIIAALLHDTVEDTDLTLDAIDQEFNGSVRNLIDGVTKLFSEDIDDRPTLDEQTETLRKIFTLMQEDIRVMVIKLVDRLHNMETIQFLSEERQRGLAQETQDVFVKIADRLCMQDLRDVLEELTLKILEQETFPALLELRKKSDEQAHEAVQMMNLEFMKPGMPKHLKIHPESKQWSDVQQQLARGKGSVTGLADVILAFECPSIPACYEVLGSLHQKWRREAMSFQDFINSPKINGYQGLHTTIILPDGVRVRCKIRTKEMQVYAHRGVAAYCFDNKAKGLLEYLPWIQHIQSLSDDTKNRSEEFFESLKSDILGESIVVHGTGDHTVLLPAGSTALDGAFYCFHDKALRVKAIQVNGQDVPFFTPLTHSVSLDVQLSARTTVQREWLDWVHTGLATAMIRSALSHQSKRQKQIMGKEILQKRMNERRLGYLEEFDRHSIVTGLTLMGYDSMESAYEAIAEGHLKAIDVVEKLFQNSGKKSRFQPLSRSQTRLQFAVKKNDIPQIRKLLDIYEKYNLSFKNIRIFTLPTSSSMQFTIVTTMNIAEADRLKREILASGVEFVEEIHRGYREYLLMAIVILLWGLNPVFSRMLLEQGMTPLSLMTYRLIIFGIFNTIVFGIWRLITPNKLAPIPGRFKLALLPSVAHVGMSFYYFALTTVPPAVHLMLLRFNTIILPLFLDIRRSARRWLMLGVSLLFLALCATFFLFDIGPTIRMGLLLSLCTLFFYTFYSVSLEKSLQAHKIKIRYPYMMFQIGICSTLVGILLIPLQPLPALWNDTSMYTTVYAIFCVCIAGASYSALLRVSHFKHITDFFLLEVPIAVLAEYVLLGMQLSPLSYAVMGISMIMLLTLRWKWRITS